jgi:replication factor C large subunit
MLLERYGPKASADIINSRQVIDIRNWLKSWKKGRALFVYGPTGSGKTLTVRLLAKELGYEILESTASERAVPEILKASEQRSLFFRKKLILIDEVELSPGTAVIKLIKKSNFPVIFISINPYKSSITALRKRCSLVRFERIKPDIIARFLKDVCRKEKIEFEDKTLFQIAKMSNGDIRAALLDLEVLNYVGIGHEIIGYRESEENVFDTLKAIFSSKNLNSAKMALNNSDKSAEELLIWLEENAGEYRSIEDIANAYNYLSKADVFASRILKRQAWSLQKYFIDLSVAGFVLNKNSVFQYQYPRPYARKNSEIAEKIAKKLHVSRKEASEEMPLIRGLMKKTDLAKELELNENDIEELG